MTRSRWIHGPCLAALLVIATGADGFRNPFGVYDVPDPDGADVQEFAKNNPGGPAEANAEDWIKESVDDPLDTIEGRWASRWNLIEEGQVGPWSRGVAAVRIVEDRIFILFEDDSGSYLIEAERKGDDRLVGRYMNLASHSDSGPWSAVIVSDERIDGVWDQGRWDLKRKLERPGQEKAEEETTP